MTNLVNAKYNKQHLLTSSLVSGLQLLGFDIKSNEEKSKTKFDYNLFAKPNSKVFEVIIHFLLCKLDPEKASKLFSKCWPVVLPEQQKEFKDILLTWLNDLSRNVPLNKPLFKNYHLLQSIKIPQVAKSLLVSPSGLKLVELLFALLQYVLLYRLLKHIDTEKSFTRVWPKIILDPKPPFSSTSQNSQSKQNLQNKNSLIKTQYEIQADSLRRQIDVKFNELNQFAVKCMEMKTKFHEYSVTKLANISKYQYEKVQLAQNLRKKKEFLYQYCKNLGNDNSNQNETSIYQTLSTKLNNEYYPEFKNNWDKFLIIINQSIMSEFSKNNIGFFLNQKENKLELNGELFLKDLKNDDSFKIEDRIPEYLKFSLDIVEKNSNKINEIELFSDDGKKLDLVNIAFKSLIRLYNSVLSQMEEMFNKIDKVRLAELKNEVDSLYISNVKANEGALKLNSKWNSIISEMSDNYEKSLLKSLQERNLIDNKNSQILRKSILEYDESSWNTLLSNQSESLMRCVIDDLLDYTKQPIIEKKKLSELREKSLNENNTLENYKSNEKHSLGFQHSSAKSVIQTETDSAHAVPPLINAEKGWSFSPIKNNQLSYSEISTINQTNGSQPRSRNDSAADQSSLQIIEFNDNDDEITEMDF